MQICGEKRATIPCRDERQSARPTLSLAGLDVIASDGYRASGRATAGASTRAPLALVMARATCLTRRAPLAP